MRRMLFIVLVAGILTGFCKNKRNYQIKVVEKSILPAGVDAYMVTVNKNLVSVRENLGECYMAFLDKNPKVTNGKVVMLWNIATTGETSGASIKSNELKDTELGSCLTGKVNQLVFNPAPEKVKNIEEEFNFNKKIEGK